jgi:hypothetical protein
MFAPALSGAENSFIYLKLPEISEISGDALMIEDETNTFEVRVKDNYNGESYSAGSFASYDEAIVECKKIVDQWLDQAITQNAGMTSAQLYKGYRQYGEDPWVGTPRGAKRFSAWDYARAKCIELLGGKIDD